MNVVMLVDSSNYHHQRQATRHTRTLPKPPKEKESSSRSKSLSRKEEAKLQAQPGAKLSTSSHQLSAQARREESVEVPVIVDEVTKWISGVTRTTTCRDVISVILRRNNHQYKVRAAPGWVWGAMLRRETRIPRTLSSDEISTNQFATLDLINVLSPHYRNPMFTNTFCASGGRRLTDHCDTQPIFSESGLLGARTGAQSGGNTQSGQPPFY